MWTLTKYFYTYKSDDFGNLTVPKSQEDPTTREAKLKLKIAMFRLEETLLTAKNAAHNVLTDTDVTNFVWLYDPDKLFEFLNNLKSKGYIVVIMSNHATKDYTHTNLVTRCTKVDFIQEEMKMRLGWSPYFVVALNRYVKMPTTKPFLALLNMFGVSMNELDKKYLNEDCNFFHCGYASGKDDPFPHFQVSSTDREFADNISTILYINDMELTNEDRVCKYIRPTDLFPHKLIGTDVSTSPVRPARPTELIIFVGTKNSGRDVASEEFRNAGYDVVDIRVFEYNKRMGIAVEALLYNGRPVIVNACNHSRKTREMYINLAKKYNFKVRILWFVRNMKTLPSAEGRERESHEIPKVPEGRDYSGRVLESPDTNTVYTQQFEEPTEAEAPVEIVY